MPPKAKKPRAKKAAESLTVDLSPAITRGEFIGYGEGAVVPEAMKSSVGPIAALQEVFLPADKTLPRPPGPEGYKGVTYGGKQTEGEW